MSSNEQDNQPRRVWESSGLTLREALLAMGYRECKPGHWLKPIGFQLLTYRESTNVLANWFKAATGTVDIYETTDLSADSAARGDYLYQLKYFECYTRTDMGINHDSRFELSALDLGVL